MTTCHTHPRRRRRWAKAAQRRPPCVDGSGTTHTGMPARAASRRQGISVGFGGWAVSPIRNSGRACPWDWCLTSFCEIVGKVILRDDGASLVLVGWIVVVVGKLSFVFRRALGISFVFLVPLVPRCGWSWPPVVFRVFCKDFKGRPQ